MKNISIIVSTKEVSSTDTEKMRKFVESLQVKRPHEKQNPCTEDDL